MSSIIWSRLDLVAKNHSTEISRNPFGKLRRLVAEATLAGTRDRTWIASSAHCWISTKRFCSVLSACGEKRFMQKNTNQVRQQKNTSHVFDLFWRVRSSTVHDPWSMPNIPLPSSRYCPFGEVSCKFHQPHHALPYILFAYLGRRVVSNQSMSCQLQHVTTMISHRPQWRQYSYVFSLTLSRGKENSWRNFPKVFSPVAQRSDCTNKKCLCSNSVSGCSQFLGSKGAVSASTIHGTWARHDVAHPRVHQRPLASIIPVCGSREVMKRIVQLWSVHRRTQGTYQVKPTLHFLLGSLWLQKQECTISIARYIYYHKSKISQCQISDIGISKSLSSWCSSRAPVSKPTAKASFCNPLRASCPKTTLQSCSKNINEHCFQVATFAKVELLACYSQTHHIPYIPQKWVCVEPSQPSKCTSEKMIYSNSMPEFCVGTNSRILCGGSLKNRKQRVKNIRSLSPHHPEKHPYS